MPTQDPQRAHEMSAATRRRIAAEITAGQDATDPQFLYSVTSTTLLLAIGYGMIDPVRLAADELANRGLDRNGAWVGFDCAREIHRGPQPAADTAEPLTAATDIARHHLGLETLDTCHRDALDFHELSTWNIRDALLAAYAAGAAAQSGPIVTRYTDLNDAMFDPRLIGNRPALDLLHSLPADQRYVIEVGPAAGQGTELRIWRLDLDHATGPVATRDPDIRFNCGSDSTEAPE